MGRQALDRLIDLIGEAGGFPTRAESLRFDLMLRSESAHSAAPEASVSKHGPEYVRVAHLSAEVTPRDDTRPSGPLLRVR
jgi:hypothetical protein